VRNGLDAPDTIKWLATGIDWYTKKNVMLKISSMNSPWNQLVAISHHGRFVALACTLPACPRP
jgi:hypothetical protein